MDGRFQYREEGLRIQQGRPRLRFLASCAGFFVFDPDEKHNQNNPFSRVQVKNTGSSATTFRSVILISSPHAQLRVRSRPLKMQSSLSPFVFP